MNTACELVQKLTELTKQNKLKWDGSDIVGYSCVYKSWEVAIEWLQDDKPTICINDAVLRGYEYGIQDLLLEVRYQGRFSEDQAKIVVKMVGSDEFNRMAKAMLQKLNSGKRRKR